MCSASGLSVGFVYHQRCCLLLVKDNVQVLFCCLLSNSFICCLSPEMSVVVFSNCP